MNKTIRQIIHFIPFAAFFLLLVMGITKPNITGNTVMAGSSLDLGLQTYGQYTWNVYLSDTYSSVGIGIYNSNDFTPNKYGGWMAYVKINGNKIWESAGNGQAYNYVTNSYESESSYKDQYFDITDHVHPGLNTVEYYHFTDGQHGPMIIVEGGTASLSETSYEDTEDTYDYSDSTDYSYYDSYDDVSDYYNYDTYDTSDYSDYDSSEYTYENVRNAYESDYYNYDDYEADYSDYIYDDTHYYTSDDAPYYDTNYDTSVSYDAEIQEMLNKIDEFETELYGKFDNAKNTAVLNRVNVGFMICRAKQKYGIDIESYSSTYDPIYLDKSYCGGDFQKSLVQFSKEYTSVAEGDVGYSDNFDLADSLIQSELQTLRTKVTNKEIVLDKDKADFCTEKVKELIYMPPINSQSIKEVDTPLSLIDKMFSWFDMDSAKKTAAASLVWAQETTRYWTARAYLLGGTDYVVPTQLTEALEEWNIEIPIEPETGFAGLVYGAKYFGECAKEP